MAPWLATVKLHPAPAHGFKVGEAGKVSNEKLVMGRAYPVASIRVATYKSGIPFLSCCKIMVHFLRNSDLLEISWSRPGHGKLGSRANSSTFTNSHSFGQACKIQ